MWHCFLPFSIQVSVRSSRNNVLRCSICVLIVHVSLLIRATVAESGNFVQLVSASKHSSQATLTTNSFYQPCNNLISPFLFLPTLKYPKWGKATLQLGGMQESHSQLMRFENVFCLNCFVSLYTYVVTLLSWRFKILLYSSHTPKSQCSHIHVHILSAGDHINTILKAN